MEYGKFRIAKAEAHQDNLTSNLNIQQKTGTDIKASFMQNICVLKTIVINLHNPSNQISKSRRILSSMNTLISFIQMPYTVAFREMTKNFPSADYSLAQLS